jgi:hypothetical protein
MNSSLFNGRSCRSSTASERRSLSSAGPHGDGATCFVLHTGDAVGATPSGAEQAWFQSLRGDRGMAYRYVVGLRKRPVRCDVALLNHF